MKSVLISIKPKYCVLIVSGQKTIEVRKTKPRIDTPFKCYIYCTKGKSKNLQLQGKVIGEFVCDKITEFEGEFWDDETYERIQTIIKDGERYYEYGENEYETVATNEDEKYEENWLRKQSCVSWEEMRKYVGAGITEFYGWHISNLVIYQEPNEIEEFYKACDKPPFTDCTWCIEKRDCVCQRLKRPPQSWCYVEELRS